MATYKDRVVKSVTHYEPGAPPVNEEDMGIYVVTELKRLANVVLNQAIFRLGDIRYADGSNWNPGSTGEGIYFFNETTSAWVKL